MTTPDLPAWLEAALEPEPSVECLDQFDPKMLGHTRIVSFRDVLAVELPRRIEALLRGMAKNIEQEAQCGEPSYEGEMAIANDIRGLADAVAAKRNDNG